MTLSIDALLAFLDTAYPGGPFGLETALSTAGQRLAYRLRGADGRFVVKISEPGRDPAIVQRDAATQAFLAGQGMAVPAPVPGPGGALVQPYQNRLLYLYPYIEGQHPRVEADLYPRLGALLARLHSLPVDDRVPASAYRPPAVLGEVRPFIASVPDLPGQRAAAADVLRLIDAFPSFEYLPQGIIHTDPYYVNLLDGADGRLYLIDWDDGGVSYPLMDVGYVLVHLTTFLPEGRKNWDWRQEWGEAFLRAYEAIRPLTDAERRLLPWAMRLAVIVYLPLWGTQQIILENYERMRMVVGDLE